MVVPYIWGDLKLCVINYLPQNCFRGCHFWHVPFEAWFFRLAIERWSQRLWRWVDSDQQNHQGSIPKWWNNNIWFYQRMRGISAPKLVTQSKNCIFASSDGTWPSKIENWKTKHGIDSQKNTTNATVNIVLHFRTWQTHWQPFGWVETRNNRHVSFTVGTGYIYKVIHICHDQNMFFFVKRDNHPMMSEDYIS